LIALFGSRPVVFHATGDPQAQAKRIYACYIAAGFKTSRSLMNQGRHRPETAR
jgi:hypothetical protein